ncbi:Bax inhibitor-1/YccA family protein [Pantoea sp. SoEX]|uniref:Bax inhibitor-1/YccA family protein n=1 Tax=Pantoea sp. SoEX TaxID=2576763 RepID=UPI00135C599D|nr:Bax inhibitor-1/YccA family protein [Pantoea sp. SoEX]MXP51040.1 Bax inhibitor-1/YccA family protein [Pantoea sp. SoEX]
MNRYSQSDSIAQHASRELHNYYITQVYGWMTCGLILTSFVAWLASLNPVLTDCIFNNRNVFFSLITIQLFLSIFISSFFNIFSSLITTGMFMFYSMLTGLVMSHIFLIFTNSSIATTFCITSIMFGCMSIYGYTTKRDLSHFNNILIMGLIGVLISSIINFILKSSLLMWFLTYISILLFVFLTASDTQKLKMISNKIDINDDNNLRRASILGAFILYLDFINLFTLLLRIGGDRNK